jgi:ABC-type nitrate/sulfonate/bicarbonate transport system substrate-binding protein
MPIDASVDVSRAVITGKDSKYQSINDVKGTKLGISRLGSGSQVGAAAYQGLASLSSRTLPALYR